MAKLGYKATIVGAEEISKLYAKYPDIFKEEIKPFVNTVGLDVEANAKAEAPVFMGALGILAPSLIVSYSHHESDVDKTIEVIDESCQFIKWLWKKECKSIWYAGR